MNFCEVKKTDERGRREYAVICCLDEDLWLGVFRIREQASEFCKQVNQAVLDWAREYYVETSF